MKNENKYIIGFKKQFRGIPIWDVEQQRLYWIDSLDGRVFSCTEKGTEIKCWDVRQKIGSMALCKDGHSAIVALEKGIYILDFITGETHLLHAPESDKPNNRFNDGKVDRQGRFVVGSMDMQEDNPSGALYRLNTDHSLHKIEQNIIVSNAPCWSPNGDYFLFC